MFLPLQKRGCFFFHHHLYNPKKLQRNQQKLGQNSYRLLVFHFPICLLLFC
nr:MAG TPA: hypothetical protein [Caudoviricetes sp.]